jgi:Relaxase/Mobilisation nuclease domain
MPAEGRPLLDVFSGGRAGPWARDRFTGAEIEQIQRTVRRTPEVMVKVTGGGRKRSAVAAHLSYISDHGNLEIETDEGEQVTKEGQKALLRDWHLELSAGQYREPRNGRPGVKLVHNIVLSMPSPTPPQKILAAAKNFAREKFALQHRYAMALHTHQQHPHVHLVVKAEGEDGRRLHIDKAMLREWREDFARMMRDQEVAANATPRVVRGQSRQGARDAAYRTRRRGSSRSVRARVESVERELQKTGTIHDPAHAKLLGTRNAVVAGWMRIASTLDAQCEIILAGDVRYFANHLPRVLTDRERLAEEWVRFLKQHTAKTRGDDRVRERTLEMTR